MIQSEIGSVHILNDTFSHVTHTNQNIDAIEPYPMNNENHAQMSIVNDDSEILSRIQEIQAEQVNQRINSVIVENSSDVQVGDSIIYNGPVTIQQYLVGRNEEVQSNSGQNRFQKYFKRRRHVIRKIVAILIGILFVYFITYLTLFLTQRESDETLESDTNVTLTLIERDQWYGRTPNYNKTSPLELPATRVIIIHSVTEPCSNLETCSLRTRSIQNEHMKKWADIGYNFLVGGDGRIYVGRGWKTEGAHTGGNAKNHELSSGASNAKKTLIQFPGFNKRSIGIAFIGNFNLELPPKISLDATKLLLESGVQQKFLSTTYKLLGHRQVGRWESPGEALYKEIQTWQHWTINVHGD